MLFRSVKNLGFKDDVVTVKNGYGLNYLIPKGIAIIANDTNKKIHAEVVKQRAHKVAKLKMDAQGIADAISGFSITLTAKAGENGKLFGSITSQQLVDKLKGMGYTIDKKQIVISLCGIFGIGRSTSKKILDKISIPHEKKVKDLTDMEQQKLADELENYTITNDLQREILSNINRLVSINCYRGKRLKAGLPAHGQRTHTNRKTARRNSKFNISVKTQSKGK